MFKIELENLSDYSRLHTDLYDQLHEYITKKADREKPHAVVMLTVPEKKTLPQLRYYWGVVLEDIADMTGYYPDEIHDFNKKNFGVKSTYFIGDEAAELIKGLSKMGKKQASIFIDRVIQHWTDQGVIIRSPDQLTQEEFIQAKLADGDD